MPNTSMYNFFSDPGHAWLEVTKAECKRLGVVPSHYSYMKADMYYLEEDCDAPLFTDAKQKAGEAFKFNEVYQENTPIRNYRSAQ